jgi:transmembrane sensor
MYRVGKESQMNSNDAEVAAGEWLARLDRHDSSPADLAAFERWKTADPRHAAAYARLEATWQALDRIQAIRPRPDEPIGSDYRIGATPRVHLRHAERTSPRGSAHRPWLWLSVAASLFVALAGIWIARTSDGPQIYRTGIGGFQRVVLGDQSAMELNTDSEVRVALSHHLRKVELVRGEASFAVAHDKSRPFVVSAGNTAVRAVGTKFNVRRLEDSVDITVDEGRVLVGAPDMLETTLTVVPPTMLQLDAGQTAQSSGSGVKLTTLPKDGVARKLAWQTQMLAFDGDSLADVVLQFNRYNERQLVVADSKLAALQIGGYFRPTNLDAFVSVLQSNFGIRVTRDGNRLVLATGAGN